MEWLVYIFIATAIGAAVLALYEHVKGKRMVQDTTAFIPHDRERAAHTNAEQIRAEGVALHNPSAGGGIY